MQSTRFDDAALTQIKHAAKHEGVSVSEFIRRAAIERAEGAPQMTALEALGDYVGMFDSTDSTLERLPMDDWGQHLLEQHQRQSAESHALREQRRAR